MISRPILLDKALIYCSYGLAGFLFVKNWGYTRSALKAHGPDSFLLATGISLIEALVITVIVSGWYAEDDWGDRLNSIPKVFSGIRPSKGEMIKIGLWSLLGLLLGAFVISVYTIDVISTAQGRGAAFGDSGALGWVKALADGEFMSVGIVFSFVIGPEVICFVAPFVQRLLDMRELKEAAVKDELRTQSKRLRMGRQLRDTQMAMEYKQQMDALRHQYAGQPEIQPSSGHHRRVIRK